MCPLQFALSASFFMALSFLFVPLTSWNHKTKQALSSLNCLVPVLYCSKEEQTMQKRLSLASGDRPWLTRARVTSEICPRSLHLPGETELCLSIS